MTKKRLLAWAAARAGNSVPTPRPPAPLARGCAFFRQGKYQEALEAWEDTAAPPAARAEASFRLGLQHQAAGRWKAALGCWQKAARWRPERAVYHFHHGRALHYLGEPAPAAVAYRRALDLEPANNRFLFHLGLAYAADPGAAHNLPRWLEEEGRGLTEPQQRFMRAVAATRGDALPAPPATEDPAAVHLLYAWHAGTAKANAPVERVLAREPALPAAWRMRALLLAAQGDPTAEDALRRALALGVRQEGLVARVTAWKKWFLNELVERGDLARAIALLTAEDKNTPAPVDPGREKLALLLTRQGNVLARQEKWAQAADFWRRAREAGDRDPRLSHNLALAAELLKRPREAATWWRRTIDAWSEAFRESDPARRGTYLATAYRHLAELAAESGSYEEYVIDLQLAMKYAPKDVPLRLDLARAHLSADEEDKAREVLKEALDLAPDDPEITGGLAMAYIKRDEWEKALPLLTRGLAANPDDPGLRRAMARYYEYRARTDGHDYDSTVPWLKKALEVTPDPTPILAGLAVYAFVNDRRRDYRKYLDEVLRLAPDDPEVRFRLARMFFQYDEARMGKKNLRRALELVPGDALARLEAADICMEAGLPQEAEGYLRAALAMDPSENTYQAAAGVCVENQAWEQALPIMTEARAAFPGRLEIIIDLAMVLVEMERYSEAYRVLAESGDLFRGTELDQEYSQVFKSLKSFLTEEL